MSRTHYVTGLRAVEQLLSDQAPIVLRLFVELKTRNPRVRAIERAAREHGIEVQTANRARLVQMCGEDRHQGVVAEVRRQSLLDEAGLRGLVEARLAEDEAPLLLLLLDGVEDPHNLGACLRTADAAGVDAVVVPRRGAAQLGPTVSKVAAGAAERLPFAPVPQLTRVLDWLAEYGVRRIGTSDRASQTIYDAIAEGHIALVMGGEHQGLSRAVAARCDELVALPMRGSVSSLNVSVAAGIGLYEIRRRQDHGAG